VSARVRIPRIRVHWSAGPRLARTPELRAAVAAALRHGGRPELALDVVIVSQEELRLLHERWLADPSVTDVITFDLSADGAGPAGELYISARQAELVAARRGIDARGELLRYAIHGALHLCGYDDHDSRQRARMRRAERRVLDTLVVRKGQPRRAKQRSRRARGSA
jgi:probable rRNA maturation factor